MCFISLKDFERLRAGAVSGASFEGKKKTIIKVAQS